MIHGTPGDHFSEKNDEKNFRGALKRLLPQKEKRLRFRSGYGSGPGNIAI